MKKTIVLLLLVCIYHFNGGAQKLEYINSGEVLQKGYDKSQEEKYDEAITLFNKVSENDTNYRLVLVAKVSALYNQEKYEEVVNICKQQIDQDEEGVEFFYNNCGNAYNKLGKLEEALNMYDEGIKKFPNYNLFYYNRAIALKDHDKHQESFEWYKKTLEISPDYAPAHLNIGLLAASEGKMTEAILAVNTYLLFKPGSKLANGILAYINDYVAKKPDLSDKKGITFSPEGDDFTEVELIIQNRVALQKSYKIRPKSAISLVKQTHALLEKVEYLPNDKGFFMQTYVWIYKEMFDKGYFEPFAYSLMVPSSNEKHQKMIRKNITDVKRFQSWFGEEWRKRMRMKNADLGEGEKLYTHWYSEDGILEAVGNREGDKVAGKWQFYNGAGQLRSKGSFNAEGNRDGEWNWFYYDGKPDETVFYDNGKVNDNYIAYDHNGNVRVRAKYKDNLYTGAYKEYRYNGDIEVESEYMEGKLHGKSVVYNKIGNKRYEVNYKDDKLEGGFIQYYNNGSKYEHLTYVDEKRDGEYKVYYRNGNLQVEGTYKEGKLEGKWTSYYKNGKVARTGTYTNGSQSGEWTSYYEDGKKKEVGLYDENGKINGNNKYYDKDGKIYYELNHEKGDIVSYKHYNKKGEVISEGSLKKGKLSYLGFYPDGTKMSEGEFVKKDKEGEWKFFDKYGKLESVDTYKKGLLDGKSRTYYRKGILKKELTYVEGKAEGYYVEYYENEQIKEEGYYANDELDGIWLSYGINGKVEEENYYIKGKRTGIQKTYTIDGKLNYTEKYEKDDYYFATYYDLEGNVKYTDGLECGTGEVKIFYDKEKKMLRRTGKYVAGIVHGTLKWYYPDNKVEAEGAFYNGARNGSWLWYHENGSIDCKGQYEYGDKVGKWEYFYEINNQTKKVSLYKDGELHGIQKRYNPNGTLRSEINYINGERQGTSYLYDGNGVLRYTKDYVDGKLISYSYKGRDQAFLRPILFNQGTGEVNAFFEDETPSIKVNYKDGYLDGVCKYYHSNGNLEEESTYNYGDLNGAYTNYFFNGKKRSEYNYKDGWLEGDCKEYYEDGTLLREGTYLHGEKHGIFKTYDKKGNLLYERNYHNGLIITE